MFNKTTVSERQANMEQFEYKVVTYDTQEEEGLAGITQASV